MRVVNTVPANFDLSRIHYPLQSVTWYLTYRCPHRCIHCYQQDLDLQMKESLELPFSIIRNVLMDLKKMNIRFLMFSGGDPFARSDVFSILDSCVEMDVNVNVICSSGYLPMSQEIINMLRHFPDVQIQYTLFSMNPVINDMITGRAGSIERILDNVMLLRKNDINVGIKTVLMNENGISSIDPIIQWCESIDIHFIGYSTELFPRKQSNIATSSLEISNDDMVRLYKKYPNNDRIEIMHKRINPPLCKAGFYLIGIDPYGHIAPCHALVSSITVGDLRQNSLEAIWNDSSEMHQFRKSQLEMELMEQCRSCKASDHCISSICTWRRCLPEYDLCKEALMISQ